MTNTPKKLWFRTLKSGKTSVGEYINAKWRNVVDPFTFATEPESIEHLQLLISNFKLNNNRNVVAVCQDDEAKSVAQYMNLEVTT